MQFYGSCMERLTVRSCFLPCLLQCTESRGDQSLAADSDVLFPHLNQVLHRVFHPVGRTMGMPLTHGPSPQSLYRVYIHFHIESNMSQE